MNTTNQKRRPIKRCRRGRFSGSSAKPTDLRFFSHFQFFENFFSYQENKYFLRLISLFLLIGIAWLALTAVAVSVTTDGVKESLHGMPFICMTSKACLLLNEYLGLNKKKINKRDIQRMIERHGNARKRNVELQKKNRALKSQLTRKKTIKPNIQISFSKDIEQKTNIIPFPGATNVVSSFEKLHNRADKFDGGKTCADEAGKILKVCFDAKVSFRGFARTLKSLKNHELYSGKYTPCATTIINWAVRAGLAKLMRAEKKTGPYIDIIDHWIGVGNVKLFVVMRLYHSISNDCLTQNRALSLEEFELVHVQLMTKSNGELVSEVLGDLYKKIGFPSGILSDSGSDLVKGIKDLNKKNDLLIPHIQDVGHKIACVIKKQYAGLRWFQKFTKNISVGQKKLNNSEFAHLRSPKQNTKARFMNISRTVNWAMKALERINKSENIDTIEAKKFNEAYGSLQAHSKRMLPNMKKTLDITNSIMKELKTKGLTESSHAKVVDLLQGLSKKNKVRLKLVAWLSSQMKIRLKLLESGWTGPLPISSDPIESLFSVYKAFQGRAPQGDPTRLVLILPLLVGQNSASDLTELIQNVSQSKTRDWIKTNIPESIHSKKRKIADIALKKKVTKKCYASEKGCIPCVRAQAA